jgi:hypothetical protein
MIALISDEHLDSLKWKQHARDNADESDEDDEDDRMFSFEVSKSKEQDEDVFIHPGFSVSISIFDGLGTNLRTLVSSGLLLPLKKSRKSLLIRSY